MSDNTLFPSIRQAVIDAASELGVSEPAVSRRVVLTRDRYCVGHRFLFDGLQAVWLMAEGVIRFFTADGALLKTIEVGEESPMNRAA